MYGAVTFGASGSALPAADTASRWPSFFLCPAPMPTADCVVSSTRLQSLAANPATGHQG